jgi:hypothetical protein
MKLLGAKDVKGFDLNKHQELVGGFTKEEAKEGVVEEQEGETAEAEKIVG